MASMNFGSFTHIGAMKTDMDLNTLLMAKIMLPETETVAEAADVHSGSRSANGP